MKNGDVHSRIGHMGFSINGKSNGISPDVFRFIFDKRAEIVGILVSIDYTDPKVTLFELEARINAPNSGYGYLDSSNALIHTTFSCTLREDCDRHTDEHVWFGKNSGIEVESGDWITFGARMGNENTFNQDVHPEFIVWYRWLE